MMFALRLDHALPSLSSCTACPLLALASRSSLLSRKVRCNAWCSLFSSGRGEVNVSDIQPYDIIVLDDLLHESKNSKDVTSMFTRAAHHKPTFIIFIMQTLFPPGKEARTRSLNTHYYCIFKNPRDKSQIEFLARQISPRRAKGIIEIFEAATEKAHSYLFLDFTQECHDELRYRSNLFQKPMIIYKLL